MAEVSLLDKLMLDAKAAEDIAQEREKTKRPGVPKVAIVLYAVGSPLCAGGHEPDAAHLNILRVLMSEHFKTDFRTSEPTGLMYTMYIRHLVMEQAKRIMAKK